MSEDETSTRVTPAKGRRKAAQEAPAEAPVPDGDTAPTVANENVATADAGLIKPVPKMPGWMVAVKAAKEPPKPAYQDAFITLYEGDFAVILGTLGKFGQSPHVDAIIADPPYSSRTHEGARRVATAEESVKAAKVAFGFSSLSPRFIRNAVDLCLPLCRSWSLLFCDDESAQRWRRAVRRSGVAEHIRQGLYSKTNPTPQITGDRPAQCLEFIEMFLNPRYWDELIEIFHRGGRKTWNQGGRPARYESKPVSDPEHKATKPLGLMQMIVEDFTDPGDTILDFCAGKGTTLLAARNLGRKAIGIEKSPVHVKNTIRRLSQLDLFAETQPAVRT